MLTYRFERLQDDGSWFCYAFTATNDDDAVAHALCKRTSNRCELYQGDRSLATFDGRAKKDEPTADDVRTDLRAPEPALDVQAITDVAPFMVRYPRQIDVAHPKSWFQ